MMKEIEVAMEIGEEDFKDIELMLKSFLLKCMVTMKEEGAEMILEDNDKEDACGIFDLNCIITKALQ